MKFKLLFFALISAGCAQAQTTANKEQAIKNTLNVFMTCITQKDSVQFYKLFPEGHISWNAVLGKNTFKKNHPKINLLPDTPKDFIRFVVNYKGKLEEKFSNIVISGDDEIAAVTFDYSFWKDGKKQNWGKESWAMASDPAGWKITSILYSTNNNKIDPEPAKSN